MQENIEAHVSRAALQARFQALQDHICRELEQIDGSGRFIEDHWSRPGGGGGRSRIIEGGLIEKGGVGFSAVFGDVPAQMARVLETDTGEQFFACGVSIVLHPRSPMVPIIHMNVRYFEMDGGRYWFGGGIDLTPHYVDKKAARRFHSHLKEVCDGLGAEYYGDFKTWADQYFYIRHRQETRGIGGIFFDHLADSARHSKSEIADFVFAVGERFIPIYRDMVNAARDLPYGDREIQWQRLRRGRYVEFNLVWDRGTKFGLDTDGRTESILMSLPPLAAWEYNHIPEAGSPEAETQALLKQGINWLEDSVAEQ